jgi:hypothetical protein
VAPSAMRRAGRRGVPWWMPLVALLALAGVVAAIAVDRVGTRASAAPATTTAAVLGTRATRTVATQPRPQHVRALAPGKRAAEHAVRVLAVVGPRIFWVRTGKSSALVHLQGPGTRWSIRPGQRLTFTGVVARNRDTAVAWGLTRREGRDRFDRQGTHLEVFGPRIRFLCVRPCG